MATTSTRRFIFRGNAMPCSARINAVDGKPSPELVTSAPTAALGVVGGRSTAASNGSSFKDVFRWGATLADSTGEQGPNGNYITKVTSSVADVMANNDPL